jgi:hypothetical protein
MHKSPVRRSPVRSPVSRIRIRNNSALRALRAIVAAKTGARHWASLTKKRVNNRGRPTFNRSSPVRPRTKTVLIQNMFGARRVNMNPNNLIHYIYLRNANGTPVYTRR